MAVIKLKRGVEANRSTVTPSTGEPLYTTDTRRIYVGDGSTAGGLPHLHNSSDIVIGVANAWKIQSDEELIVSSYRQYAVFGELVIDGVVSLAEGAILVVYS